MDQFILDGHEPRPEPDLLTWARWFETADRRVMRSTLANGLVVSTVFIGLDMDCQRAPLLFETCVFPPNDHSEVTDRYCTWAEAEAGHLETVARLTRALGLPS